nr:immunoglobulin light chain junction region [Macaca mulatta]MOY16066.1 immunoglobulin light chain junction region [Macaca mulatta]
DSYCSSSATSSTLDIF